MVRSIALLEIVEAPPNLEPSSKQAMPSSSWYDDAEVEDTSCPKVEVSLLADPAMMVRRIIKDDGRDTVDSFYKLADKVSINDIMKVPRLPMLQSTKWNLTAAFDSYIRHRTPLPNWYHRAFLYDS
jgi:hypothetical protein